MSTALKSLAVALAAVLPVLPGTAAADPLKLVFVHNSVGEQ